MYNIFDNIKVESARTDSHAGQFRYRVTFWVPMHSGHKLRTKEEFVIDTTDNLGECLAVAQDMVRDAIREENKRGG